MRCEGGGYGKREAGSSQNFKQALLYALGRRLIVAAMLTLVDSIDHVR